MHHGYWIYGNLFRIINMSDSIKIVDTRQYVQTLRELTEQGQEVSMMVAGGSMSPFLVHQRDVICFQKPAERPGRGDMVFYQRKNGQFVMHRIWRAAKEGYYLVAMRRRALKGRLKKLRFLRRLQR